jgi:hypothetical protein
MADGLLLFRGPEPHQRWQTYAKAFLGVAERCVRRIVSLGALWRVPSYPASAGHGALHRHRRAVVARSLGDLRPPTYEGPTGISTIVLDAAERRGMHHVGFMSSAALSPGCPESSGDQAW